jgi:C4-dicarboxylate transporter DctM subunit
MVMDGVSALIVAVPLVLPLAARFGLSPFHLAMMVILNLELAFCMPPLGLNLFISSFRFRLPVTTLYRAVVPFVGLAHAEPRARHRGAHALDRAGAAGHRRRAGAGREGGPASAARPGLLECVQADGLDPKPCTDADRAKYATPDAGTDEDEDDALMKQMLQ